MITPPDPLALRVARRYLAALQTSEPAMLAPAATAEMVAREYHRRREGLVPVDDEEKRRRDRGPSRSG